MNIKKIISEKIKIDGVTPNSIFELLSVPPKAEMGDFALPCFSFAKIQKCAPNTIAERIAKSLQSDDLIDHTEILNGYLNIYLNKQKMLASLVDELFATKNLAKNTSGKGKKVCLDFSSVNIAKEPHIGHFFSTVAGASIARLFEASGYKVVRMNYLGDYGSQFAKLVELKKKIETNLNIKIPYLSMGMSEDYLDAIKEGTTHIRLGRILFIE